MIIKKKFAQSMIEAAAKPVAKPKPRRSMEYNEPFEAEEPQEDPLYAGDLSPEVFEEGSIPDRRRKDRRHGFRRVEDQALISRAEEEANAIRENAHKEGFQEGLNQAEGVIDELRQSIDIFLNAKEKALETVVDDLSKMAMDIARKILQVEVSCDEELVVNIARKTIGKVGRDQKSIELKVNPVDFKIVQEAMDKGNTGAARDVEIRVMEDPDVDHGSCIIESRAGLIDARFSTQLEVLEKLLTP